MIKRRKIISMLRISLFLGIAGTVHADYQSNRYGTWIQRPDGSYEYSSTLKQQTESGLRAAFVSALVTFALTKNPQLDPVGVPMFTGALLSGAINLIISELALKDSNRLVQIPAIGLGVYGGYLLGKTK